MNDHPAPLLLDVDTGIDDALAIIYLADAQQRGHVDILAAGTVAGNGGLTSTTRNTLKVLELSGLSVPVAEGAARPLVGELRAAPGIHGEDGLAETWRWLEPSPAQAAQDHAVDQLLRLSHEHAGELTLLATGPLSNVALAFLKDPSLCSRLKRVVVMGGGVTDLGNITPSAEANFYNDPEAARIVFRSGARITMIGLDVTHKAIVREQDLAPLETISGTRSRFVLELLRYYMGRYEAFGWGRQACLHDPLAAAVCVDSSVVRCESLPVDIETRGELTRGMSVADLRRRKVSQEASGLIEVALELDQTRFLSAFMGAITRWAQAGL